MARVEKLKTPRRISEGNFLVAPGAGLEPATQ